MIGHYYSDSKGDWVKIEEMATPHLMHAWAKLGKAYYYETDEASAIAIGCKVEELAGELMRRGFAMKDGQWVAPLQQEAR